MALCGPAPAVLIGVVSVLVDSFRNHLAPHKVLTNTATYAVIPLVVGLGIEGLEGVTDIETNNVTFALVVFGAFVVSFALNFAIIAADVAVKTGIPIRRQVSQVLVPVLPVELATALLTRVRRDHLPRDRAGRVRAVRARPARLPVRAARAAALAAARRGARRAAARRAREHGRHARACATA